VCPNDCSGHGKCRLVSDLEEATQSQTTPHNAVVGAINGLTEQLVSTPGADFPYTKWDGDKIQACVCDGEFYGPDCSQRYCPKGDDVLTSCGETTTATQAFSVQTLTVSSDGGAGTTALTGGMFGSVLFGGDFLVHFTDNHGEVWTTQAMKNFFDGTQGAAATLLENALQAIPNFKVPGVTVTSAVGEAQVGQKWSADFTVTFDHARNTGNQQLLACDPLPLGCQSSGCSPMYRQPNNWNRANAGFAAPTYAGGGTLNALYLANWATTGILTFFTTDSILDNSAWAADQMFVRLTFALQGYAAAATPVGPAAFNDLYAAYSVEYSASTAFTGAGAIDCAANTPYCAPTWVPTGLLPTTTAGFPLGTGVGYNHVPIGYGMYVNLVDRYAGMDEAIVAIDSSLTFIFTLTTARCAVAETTRADNYYEDEECSGRGTCDHSVGVCTCFEGHFGDACSLQTILV
jgi:hypothetical protein